MIIERQKMNHVFTVAALKPAEHTPPLLEQAFPLVASEVEGAKLVGELALVVEKTPFELVAVVVEMVIIPGPSGEDTEFELLGNTLVEL